MALFTSYANNDARAHFRVRATPSRESLLISRRRARAGPNVAPVRADGRSRERRAAATESIYHLAEFERREKMRARGRCLSACILYLV